MTESDALPALPVEGRVLDARLHLLDRLVVDVDVFRSPPSTIWNSAVSSRAGKSRPQRLRHGWKRS